MYKRTKSKPRSSRVRYMKKKNKSKKRQDKRRSSQRSNHIRKLITKRRASRRRSRQRGGIMYDGLSESGSAVNSAELALNYDTDKKEAAILKTSITRNRNLLKNYEGIPISQTLQKEISLIKQYMQDDTKNLRETQSRIDSYENLNYF